MTVRPLHRWLALGTGAVLVAALAGCMPLGVVCPAIGYVSVIEVELTGDIAAVDSVQFCDGDGQCSAELPPDPTPRPTTLPMGTTLPMATSSPMTPPAYTGTRVDARRWTFTVIAGLPDGGTATAYRADGAAAGDATATLDWKRVGGSAQCGGPMKAEPIVLQIG